jgi:hypothetical protein
MKNSSLLSTLSKNPEVSKKHESPTSSEVGPAVSDKAMWLPPTVLTNSRRIGLYCCQLETWQQEEVTFSERVPLAAKSHSRNFYLPPLPQYQKL